MQTLMVLVKAGTNEQRLNLYYRVKHQFDVMARRMSFKG